MKKQSLLVFAAALLSVAACDSGDATHAAQAGDAEQKKQELAQTVKNIAIEEVDAAKSGTPDKSERLAASGLAVGERFKAFEIVNCESGDKYCQVCQYGPNPKILAAGAFDDAEFSKDLKELDALVARYGDKVKAFAVMGELKDGKMVTPMENRDALQAQAKKLKEELGLSFPIVIPAAEGDAPNEVWESHYGISQSRTLMFADGRNVVQYSAVAPTDMSALDSSVQSVIGAG